MTRRRVGLHVHKLDIHTAGWKRASGQRNLSLPMVTSWPSGSSYDFSKEVDKAAVAISCSKSRATKQSFSFMSRTISRSAIKSKYNSFKFLKHTKFNKNTRGGEGVATFSQDLYQVVGQVATSQIQTDNTIGHSVTWYINELLKYAPILKNKFINEITSKIGTVWVTPSPESSTKPVVRPEAYRDKAAWKATYMAGGLKVSNMICIR